MDVCWLLFEFWVTELRLQLRQSDHYIVAFTSTFVLAVPHNFILIFYFIEVFKRYRTEITFCINLKELLSDVS